ncbi:MAG: PKD domain-containing protein, partial [Candidatus Aenigmarchaeota archaeon]|nr:PKD domain-containing protein [Candidatus Aenigmarchaeota archaeon]
MCLVVAIVLVSIARVSLLASAQETLSLETLTIKAYPEGFIDAKSVEKYYAKFLSSNNLNIRNIREHKIYIIAYDPSFFRLVVEGDIADLHKQIPEISKGVVLIYGGLAGSLVKVQGTNSINEAQVVGIVTERIVKNLELQGRNAEAILYIAEKIANKLSGEKLEEIQVRIGKSPLALFSVDTESPEPDQMITFDASKSFDEDGSIESYEWDFGHDSQIVVFDEIRPQVKYPSPGRRVVKLIVTDDDGLKQSYSQQFVIGQSFFDKFNPNINTPPEISLNLYRDSEFSRKVIADLAESDKDDEEPLFCSLDWGDGKQEAVNPVDKQHSISHVYGKSGIFEVKFQCMDRDTRKFVAKSADIEVYLQND